VPVVDPDTFYLEISVDDGKTVHKLSLAVILHFATNSSLFHLFLSLREIVGLGKTS
jgi:hypothetical protein